MADVTDRVVYAYRSNGGAMRFFTSHRKPALGDAMKLGPSNSGGKR